MHLLLFAAHLSRFHCRRHMVRTCILSSAPRSHLRAAWSLKPPAAAAAAAAAADSLSEVPRHRALRPCESKLERGFPDARQIECPLQQQFTISVVCWQLAAQGLVSTASPQHSRTLKRPAPHCAAHLPSVFMLVTSLPNGPNTRMSLPEPSPAAPV